jgi:catechol 2,3-dioxygenase-like lactoylglutathione lyase family enzyme
MSNTTEISDIKTPTTSVLKLKFISHGTLEARDFDRSRRFYEDFMGFEVIRASNMSLMIRLGGEHIYVVVPKDEKGAPMSVRNHNGVDVFSDADVDEAYRLVVRDAEQWGLHKISKPMVQHGTYSFYFWDGDDNSWEILCNPKGGYSWMFERGDQQGKGSQDRSFVRPTLAPANTD